MNKSYTGLADFVLVLVVIIGSPFFTVWMLSRATPISLQEGQYGAMCYTREVDAYIYQHYDHGLILADQGTNDFDAGSTGIDFKNVDYQGSGHYWTEALAHPERVVEWIVINLRNPTDLIAQHINVRGTTFNANFELVAMQSDGAMLFHLRGLPPLPNRAPMPQYAYPHVPCY